MVFRPTAGAGNRIRITAQLIDAATGGHLWAERYDRVLTDIFKVQDDATHHIVDALKVKLTLNEEKLIADTPTNNLAAHDLFLQGRALATSPHINGKVYAQAVEFFTRAIALDPGYAQAHAGMAMMHILNFHNHWIDDPNASLRLAGECAAKAIAL